MIKIFLDTVARHFYYKPLFLKLVFEDSFFLEIYELFF